MTPSEERVWEAINRLPKPKREKDFKRRDLGDVPNTPERTVKKCLQSLCESGYLESDGRMGRMGSTYTMLREDLPAEFEIILAHLPITVDNNSQTLDRYEDSTEILIGTKDLSISNQTLPNTVDSDGEVIRSERAAIELEGMGLA